MRKTKYERTINYYQFQEGMLVEQSPGYQLISYSVGGMYSKTKKEFLLPMPWVRLWNPGRPTYAHSTVQAMWAKQSFRHEAHTRTLKGYLIALPCIMPGRIPCAGGQVNKTLIAEERALNILQIFWGSAFCFHWEAPHTWGSRMFRGGSNPFWTSFGVEAPSSTHDIEGGDVAIMQVFEKWEKLSLEDLDSRPYSSYDVVIPKLTLVQDGN